MKRMAVFLILVGFITVVSAPVYAQRYQVGADIALKVQYFRFMDSAFKDAGAENGVFVGVEAYKQLFIPNLYFGLEAGWAGTSGSFNEFNARPFEERPFKDIDLDVNYVPIEFNGKYVFEINPCLFFDLGAGFSINYIDRKAEAFGVSVSEDDWLWGGQFFGEMNYNITPNLFVGIGVKYQLTQNVTLYGTRTDTSADNLRAGAQLGYKF